jgi:hypothetical protein
MRQSAFATVFGCMLVATPALGQSVDKNAIYDNNKSFVLRIRASGLEGGRVETGTGVIISPEGHVLTALHVIGGKKDIEGRRFEITRLDSDGMAGPVQVNVTVVAVREALDLALLQITRSSPTYADIKTDKLKGTPVLVAIIWNPNGKQPVWISGDLGVTDPGLQGTRLTINMQAIPGNSGAPVFDASGQLVAIVTNQLGEGADSRSLTAAPLSAAKDLLPLRSAAEREGCEVQKRLELENRQKFERAAAVECAAGAPPKYAVAEYQAPSGYMIAGVVDHDDTANEFGWVDAAEYGAPDSQGHVATVKVKVECVGPNRINVEAGRASTKMRVTIMKIWTASHDEEVLRQCGKP